jgi:hypothetical protein
VHVPGGLKLDRGADLLDREARRDGHTELARRDQASDLLYGAGGGVSAVCRCDSVDLCSDGGDALVGNAKFSCRLDTLLAMIESGEIAHAQTQAELLAAIDEILNAGRVTGELRAEDIAASLIGIFTVAHPPEHDARASRLLNILMDGLRSTA